MGVQALAGLVRKPGGEKGANAPVSHTSLRLSHTVVIPTWMQGG